MKSKILELLQSGIYENIELAEQLIIGQNLKEYFYGKFDILLKRGETLLDLFINDSLYLSGRSKLQNVLSDSVCELIHLKYLKLSACSITKLPIEFLKLKNLVELFLTFNNIEYLPLWLDDLPNLKIVNIEGNINNAIIPKFKNIKVIEK
jgi:Leucine-rich repeat (LRR) protein